MIQRIINNFYLRNLAVLFLFISPDILQDVADIKRLGLPYLVRDISGLTAFYVFFVFHNHILYEKIFLRKKYLLYALTFLITIFCWRESTSYLIWLVTKPPSETVYHIVELKDYNWIFWVFIYWADIIYIYISLGVYLAFKYFKERTLILQAENMQKELELKQLNEQLNPHFLFNALNNIYSHLLHEPGNGKELILKLSELMRYVLDSSKKVTVPLADELKFIENYIAFEIERLGERCNVDYRKEITTIRFNIVPLILFNFIENAFKHGTTSINRSNVSISIHADDGSLHLFIENTIFSNQNQSTNTGLNNAKRRLELLYPEKYILDIIQVNGKYTVCIEINNAV